MKKYTRLVCLILVLGLFAAMALGSGSESEEGKKEIAVTEEEAAPQEKQEAEVPAQEASADEAQIQQTVLLEQDGIRITANEYVYDDIWGEGIKLLVENESDKNVGINCSALIVNDCMISNLFAITVAPGKKANETLWLSSSELESGGIENVGLVEAYFNAYDADSFNTIMEPQHTEIRTSLYDQRDSDLDDSGMEFYNANGIRIVGRYVDEESFWGTAVLLYVENHSGHNISVLCEDMSINGFMVTPFLSSYVYDGKKSLDEITVFETELEENGIETVEDIELTFRIVDSDTYQEIDSTGAIQFTAQ